MTHRSIPSSGHTAGPLRHRADIGFPADWRVSSVGVEFRIQLGKMLDADRNTGAYKRYIGNRAVQRGWIDVDGIRSVPMTPSDLRRFRLRKNDLLVCEGGEIGRAAIWNEPIPECYYQKALHRLRPKGSYDPYLMMSLLHLWTSNGYLDDYVTQTSIAHLTKEKLEVVPLPVPPLPEQRAITETLSDVDGPIQALEVLIAKKRVLKRAAMQQLLTGKTRLPGFNEKWRAKRIGDLLTYERPDRYLVGSSDYSDHGDVPVLTGNKSFVLGHVNDRSDTCGDIPAIVFDDFTTECNYADFPFKVKSSAIKLLRSRGTHTNLRFLFERMRLLRFPVGDHKRYYISEYQTVELLVPRRDEQDAIVAVLSDIDAEIAALERRLRKTCAIKQGMMQQLLTGRVRLVDSAATAAT